MNKYALDAIRYAQPVEGCSLEGNCKATLKFLYPNTTDTSEEPCVLPGNHTGDHLCEHPFTKEPFWFQVW